MQLRESAYLVCLRPQFQSPIQQKREKNLSYYECSCARTTVRAGSPNLWSLG